MLKANLAVMRCLDMQVKALERSILSFRVRSCIATLQASGLQ